MKKHFAYVKFFLLGVTFFPLFLGCAGLGFYDRKVSMKESCILEWTGEETISYISGENGKGKEIHGGYAGMETLVLPSGSYTLVYSYGYKSAIDAQNEQRRRQGESYWYTNETFYAESEPFTFEARKRYRIERTGATFTITEKGNSISKGGMAVALHSSPEANFFGWRYDNSFMLFEAGQQMGFYVISDPIVMVFSGGGTMGYGLFNNLNLGNMMNIPYRAGGSVATYFGDFNFMISLGGGITGYVFSMDLLSDDNPFPKVPQIPYVQIKLGFKGVGLFIDYYPTQTPIGIGSFGFGMTMFGW